MCGRLSSPFQLVFLSSPLAEVKSRLNRSYTGEELDKLLAEDKTVRVNKPGLVALVCRDAFSQFTQAFENQGADIVLVDLTHSQFGDILSASALESGIDFTLETAFDTGTQLLAKGEKVVIIYSEIFTTAPQNVLPIASVVDDRDHAEQIGRKLDKLEKDHYKKNGKFLSYFEVIQAANSIGQ
jgi:hypothetical protein